MFGDIFDQFKGKVREAFDFLMKRKSGDLLGVFHRAEIGDIDLVWGSHERHEGLEHIIQDHLIDADDFNSVEELMSIINDVINNGKIEPRESQDKIHIEKDGYRVSIKKQYRDDKGNVLFKKNWVVTAFDTKRKERDKKRTSPRGTLTTPPSNPSERIDGVTLPSSDASSADKSSKSSGNGKGNEGKKAEKPKAKKTEGQKMVEKITGKDVEKPKAKADGIEAGKFSLAEMSDGELDTEYMRLYDIVEKPARIEKLRKSEPVNIEKKDYVGKYDLNVASAQKWIKDNIRGEYTIKDTGEKILVSKVGAEEVTSHNRYDAAHLKSVSSIPRMLESAIFLEEEINTKGNGKYDSYRYYTVGLNIDGVEYTAKIVVGVKQGKRYYDHHLTQIEKTKLIDLLNQPTSGFTTAGNASLPPYAVGKDSKLISILQVKPGEIAEAESRMRAIVDEAARRKGYDDNSDYQGTSAFNGAAPAGNAYFPTREERVEAFENGEFDGDATLGDFMEAGLDNWDLEWHLNDPRSYRLADDERREAIANLREVVNGKKKTVKMYRSVPSSVKEGSFRNGDWITPSRKYAVENAEIHGWGNDYRIIEREVPVDDVWWDGNDIAEWGYDDGKGYAYKNTENNRKLSDVVTRDDNGEVILPSRRFDDTTADIRFSIKNEETEKIFNAAKKKFGTTYDLPEEGKLSITEDAEKEREEIARRAKADGTWMKAPDGTTSRLDERQWAEVRTAPFKDWFGDWELAARLNAIKKLAAINSAEYKMLGTPEKTYMSLGTATNENDGTIAKFDHDAFKKNHKIGGKFETIIPALKAIFEKSILLSSEKDLLAGTARKDGTIHKTHRSVKEYRQYIGKALINGDEEYVRFTVRMQTNQNGIHNVFVTDVDIYNNLFHDASLANSNVGARLVNGRVVDTKLEKFFETAKDAEINSSKIVGENGEPLVVYHGTNGTETVRRWNEDRHDYDTEHSRFTVFRRRVDGLRNYGAFFNSSEDNAGGYGNEVYAVYLNMRNPLVIDCRGRSYSDIEYDGEVKDTYDWADYAERMGYDGVVFKNVRDGVDYGGMMTETDDYVVFRPNQIKSATENVGTFDRENPDIRFSLIGEVGAASIDKTRKDRSLIDDLTVAKRMEEAGKSSRDIWTATGWERGADGKWRYEIASAYDIDVTGNAQWVRDHEGAARMKELRRKHNGELLGIDKVTDAERAEYDELKKKFGDVNFAQRIGNPDRAFVGDFLNDTELLEAWPELRKVTVIPEEMKGMDGYYRASDNTIRIEKGIWDKRLINQTNFKRVFVHEVQHKIQELEGFAQGGNSSWAAGKILELTRHWEITEFVNEMRETAEEHPEMGVDELAEAVMREDTLEYSLTSLDIAAAKRIYEGLTADNMEAAAEYRRDHDTLQRILERMGDVSLFRLTGEDVYRRLMGEVEARNAETRMAAESREKPMSETEDYPRGKQIEVHGGRISAMGSRVDKRMAEIGEYYNDKELTSEQRAVVDVFSGKADKLPIKITDSKGKPRKIIMRQGGENGAGSKHSIYRHFGTRTNYYGIDDVIRIPEIIKTGTRGQDNSVVKYEKRIGDDIYTVTTRLKSNGEESFTNFYTNKKPTAGNNDESNTAKPHASQQSESFDGKVTENNSNMQENEGSFSITAEDAGRSRKSAVEAMGGEERWGEWLDAAAARRLGGSRSAGRREETRARLHRLAAGEGYDPAAMADFRQTLVNNVADGGAATMNVTDADVRLALFEATKNEKGGVSEIAEDALTERRLREAAAASHDEMEDVLSQELRFSLFGGLHRKQAILDFSYLNYGLNDADIAGLEAVRRAMEETPLADANRHGLLPMIHELLK